MLEDKKILFTGATGQAVRPAAEAYALRNEVWCLARFTDSAVRDELQASGICTSPWSMGETNLDGLDADFTHVVHAAPYRGGGDYDVAAQLNAAGTGALMYHCRSARSFIFISSFAVYSKPATPDHLIAESDPLGGHAPYRPTYPVAKLSAEGAVRGMARALGLPSTIGRLNVCYGPTGWGGLPIEFFTRMLAGEPIWEPRDGRDVWSSPISTDDITHFLEPMWDVASPDTTIINLAGDEAITTKEWCTFLARRAGLDVTFEGSDVSRESFASDNTRRRQLIGECSVSWQDGMVRAVEARFPGAFSGSPQKPIAKVEANIWGQR